MTRARTRPGLRHWLGTMAVFGLVTTLGLGLPAIDAALPAGRQPPAGRPYLVGAGVRVIPPDGSVIDVTRTRPGSRTGAVLFQLGTVRLAITAAPARGDLAAVAARLRTRITARRGVQVVGVETPTSTDSGLVGLAGGYASAGRVGRYVVFSTNGIGIEVTVSGADVDLRGNLDRINASIRSLRYGGRR